MRITLIDRRQTAGDGGERDLLRIPPADFYVAAVGSVIPDQELDERRFAAPVLSDDSDGLPRFHREGDAADGGFLRVRVRERHVAHVDPDLVR